LKVIFPKPGAEEGAEKDEKHVAAALQAAEKGLEFGS
jgi:hypothetical protein